MIAGKLDPGRDVCCRGGHDGVYGIVAQVALWITSHRGIHWGAAFHEWIAISNRKRCLIDIACPVGADALTELGAVAGAVVAGPGNGFIARKLSIHGAVEGSPGVH